MLQMIKYKKIMKFNNKNQIQKKTEKLHFNVQNTPL